MDALGASIRIDARGAEVMRVLPRTNEAVNEEWITDKTRHTCDGLMRQRLDRPFVRVDGRLQPASWAEAFAAVAGRIRATKPERIGVIAGDLQDAESMKATMDLFTSLGVKSLDCRQDGSALHPRWGRASYLFNSTIAGIERADAVMLIGCDLKKEAPLLAARLRKRWLQSDIMVGVVGEPVDLTFPHAYLGDGAAALQRFVDHGPISKKTPAFVIGQGALARPDGAAVLQMAAAAAGSMGLVAEGWNGFNVLHTAAARVGGLDMGFVPGEGGKSALAMVQADGADVLFLLGADEIDLSATRAFVVYVGSHGDAGAARADVILPGAAYTEKPGIYVNTEGRVQMANRAVFPKGEAKEDWTILRALSDHLGARLPYDSLEQLRLRLMVDHPTFGQVDWVADAPPLDLSLVGEKGEVSDTPFKSPIRDFYQTNPIARASVTMAECSALSARPLQMAAE